MLFLTHDGNGDDDGDGDGNGDDGDGDGNGDDGDNDDYTKHSFDARFIAFDFKEDIIIG